jgi:hypothetical protein
MNLWQTSMKRAVPVLLAAAVVTSAAQAAQPAGRAGAGSGDRPVAGYSPQELMGMSISHPWVPGFRARYHSQAKKIALQELMAIGNSHPYVSASHVKELMATVNNSVPSATVSSVDVPKPLSARSGGFDWGDAGIGAMSGFAFALVFAGSLLFLLPRRSRGDGASTPQTV